MTKPIEAMINAAVTCNKCGTKGFGNCDCYEQCTCGWIAERGTPCRNPATKRCSTKVKYGNALTRRPATKEGANA